MSNEHEKDNPPGFSGSINESDKKPFVAPETPEPPKDEKPKDEKKPEHQEPEPPRKKK